MFGGILYSISIVVCCAWLHPCVSLLKMVMAWAIFPKLRNMMPWGKHRKAKYGKAMVFPLQMMEKSMVASP